jgi:hypothetical protein
VHRELALVLIDVMVRNQAGEKLATGEAGDGRIPAVIGPC